uniref:C2H2-type domain-containing protein n=1 Tax=Clastoptera arizonana TaxID=38151 RepID=A0A1B6D8U4_9HEMI
MKLSGGDSEIIGMSVEPLLMNTCWNIAEHFLDTSAHQKIMLGDTEDEDSNSKSAMEDLDLLLKSAHNTEQNNNLAELKPLPPFNYGIVNINGIPGHHYQSIATAPSPPRVETNNNSTETTNQNTVWITTDQVVSSSTMDCNLDVIKTEVNNVDYNNLLPPDIEDIAEIIGSAIADTTENKEEASRDSWMDIDEWFDGTCAQNNPAHGGKSFISTESIQEFANLQLAANTSPSPSVSISFHASHLKREPLTSNYAHMPLLQSRLQNGPPKHELACPLTPNNGPKQGIHFRIVSECSSPSSSTPYLANSPPGDTTVSTSVWNNQVHSSTRLSPELQVSFPHTTTPSKKSKSRSKSKTAMATSTVVFNEGALGKEKPVHRCTICNRGFLNKSNIKVHLRTHTGEKPFRCEVCGKAFRQKAHLIKHAQIHKRIGRD